MGRAAIQQTDWLWMLATGSELARPDGERAGIPCRAAARRPTVQLQPATASISWMVAISQQETSTDAALSGPAGQSVLSASEG
jgi:hypothetical protein